MSVFRSIVFTAATAGLLVGLTVTAVQQVGTVPLILKAEVFEKQAELGEANKPIARASQTAAAAHSDSVGNGVAHDHKHAVAAWEPTYGLKRNAYTTLFNVVVWAGFGLCLAGVLVLSRRPITWREGSLWGLGGFAATVLGPGLGLPPELPGIPVADLLPRQIWWVSAALATALGLCLIAHGRSPRLMVVGVGLIVVPHVIGAPMLEHVETDVPEMLSRQFVSAVTVTAFLSWVLLGGLTGYFLRRFSDPVV